MLYLSIYVNLFVLVLCTGLKWGVPTGGGYGCQGGSIVLCVNFWQVVVPDKPQKVENFHFTSPFFCMTGKNLHVNVKIDFFQFLFNQNKYTSVNRKVFCLWKKPHNLNRRSDRARVKQNRDQVNGLCLFLMQGALHFCHSEIFPDTYLYETLQLRPFNFLVVSNRASRNKPRNSASNAVQGSQVWVFKGSHFPVELQGFHWDLGFPFEDFI